MKTIGIIFAMQEELIELKKYLHINNEKKIYDLGSMTMARKNIVYLASVINWHNEMQINTDYDDDFLDEIEDMDDFMTVEPPYEGVNDDLKYNYATLEFVALSEVNFYEIFKSVKGKRIDGYEVFKNIGAVYKKYYNHDIIW